MFKNSNFAKRIIFTLSLIFMPIVVIEFCSEYYVDEGIFIGWIIIPLLTALLSFLLYVIYKKILFPQLPILVMLPIIVLVMIIADTAYIASYFVPNSRYYFEHLYYARSMYALSDGDRSFSGVPEEVVKDVKNQLPYGWRIGFINKDSYNNSMYWFVGLRPSIINGSYSYIGIYNKQDGSESNLVSEEVIRREVIKEEGIKGGEFIITPDYKLFNRKITYINKNTSIKYVIDLIVTDKVLSFKVLNP